MLSGSPDNLTVCTFFCTPPPHLTPLSSPRNAHGSNLGASRLSASGIADLNNTQDVKELTPEFFYLPDFLTNSNDLPMGTRQDGRQVNNVELPPWARGSAREFILLHRRALESEYVHLVTLCCLGCASSGLR